MRVKCIPLQPPPLDGASAAAVAYNCSIAPLYRQGYVSFYESGKVRWFLRSYRCVRSEFNIPRQRYLARFSVVWQSPWPTHLPLSPTYISLLWSLLSCISHQFLFCQKKIHSILFRLICTVLIWSQKIDCLLLFFTLYKTISLWVKLQRKYPYFFVVRLKKRKLQSKELLTVLASPSFVCLDRHSVFSISCKKTDMKFKVQKKFSGSETDHSLVLLSTHF